MEEIVRILGILAAVFLVLTLLSIIIPNFPKIPGDIFFDKLGFNLYIPFTSAIVIAVILTLLLNYFKL